MEQPCDRSSQPAKNGAGSGSDTRHQDTGTATDVVAVPILTLWPADSPRLNGEDQAHIARLAEMEGPLPPILVDRRTMRVIDGMHRLMAASMLGRETINVIFYDGSETDVFLRAVQENIAHGLPLSQPDRRAAAERIIASHPHLSDRAIGEVAGLAAKTVAAIRKRSSHNVPRSSSRLGRDGRVRPLDSGTGRQRAAELLIERPEASLRDVARVAGISPATVLDVRKRLKRGESPVPSKAGAAGTGGAGADGSRSEDRSAARGTSTHLGGAGLSVPSPRSGRWPISRPAVPDPATTVEKLLRDPSLRDNEQGRGMLRLLHMSAVGAEQLPDAVPTVPPHCIVTIVRLARQFSMMWQEFAKDLDGRARIIDPPGSAQ